MRRPSSAAAWAGALVLGALLLRGCGAGDVAGYTGDERLHVAQANAFATGHGVDGAWWNPPLSYEVLRASTSALGDGPWGRRLRNVVLGALTPLAVLLLGMALFPGRRRAAWIAAALVAVDPLLVALARGTHEEVQGAFLLVLAALGVVLARAGRPALLAAGVALGAALASKHYFPLAALVLAAYAVVPLPPPGPGEARGAGAPLPVRSVAIRLGLVALAVYAATYLPWFRRGYGLAEWAQLHLDVLRAQRALDATAFGNVWLPASGTAREWFVVPSMLAIVVEPGDGVSRYFALGRNFPAWLAVLPACVALGVHAIRRRSAPDALLVALFAAVWLPLLAAGRPIFVHSAAALLPVALLAVARAADLLAERWRGAAFAWLGAALLFAAFLYPLATERPVPDALYRPFLSRMVLVDPRGGAPVHDP